MVPGGPGTITELEPGRVLVHDWSWPGEPDSQVRWELETVGEVRAWIADQRRAAWRESHGEVFDPDHFADAQLIEHAARSP